MRIKRAKKLAATFAGYAGTGIELFEVIGAAASAIGLFLRPWSRVCLLLILLAAPAAGQNQPAETLWTGPARSIPQPSEWAIERTFNLAEVPESASLRVAADFCQATVEVNGKQVLRVSPYSLPIPVSVSRACQRGDNQLIVRCLADGGPSAVALELATSDPTREDHVVRTNDAWRLSGDQFDKVSTFGAIDREAWWHVKTRPSTSAFDEYNQWHLLND